MERKCADTIGTVLVPRAGHFQCYTGVLIAVVKIDLLCHLFILLTKGTALTFVQHTLAD